MGWLREADVRLDNGTALQISNAHHRYGWPTHQDDALPDSQECVCVSRTAISEAITSALANCQA